VPFLCYAQLALGSSVFSVLNYNGVEDVTLMFGLIFGSQRHSPWEDDCSI
jgi:hypothetical protein